MSHLLLDHNVGRFIHIVIQKDIVSQVVGRNIRKKLQGIKKKLATKQKLNQAKMLKKLSRTVWNFTFPQLSMKRTCFTQQLSWIHSVGCSLLWIWWLTKSLLNRWQFFLFFKHETGWHWSLWYISKNVSNRAPCRPVILIQYYLNQAKSNFDHSNSKSDLNWLSRH